MLGLRMATCLRPEPGLVQACQTVRAPEPAIALTVLQMCLPALGPAQPLALAAAPGPTSPHVQALDALPAVVFKTFLTFLEPALLRVQVVGPQRVRATAMCSLAARRTNSCTSVRRALRRGPRPQIERAIVRSIDRLT